MTTTGWLVTYQTRTRSPGGYMPCSAEVDINPLASPENMEAIRGRLGGPTVVILNVMQLGYPPRGGH